MMKLNREQIINQLKDWKYNLCVSCKNDDCNTCVAMLLGKSLFLINELTEENEKLNIDLEAIRCAANSYKIHCDKLSEEILNAFEQGQKQATSRTVAKVRDRLRDMNEFNLNADNGALYYIDLQAWMEEIEVDILKEKKND